MKEEFWCHHPPSVQRRSGPGGGTDEPLGGGRLCFLVCSWSEAKERLFSLMCVVKSGRQKMRAIPRWEAAAVDLSGGQDQRSSVRSNRISPALCGRTHGGSTFFLGLPSGSWPALSDPFSCFVLASIKANENERTAAGRMDHTSAIHRPDRSAIDDTDRPQH